jgi:hypothetical protein
MKKANTFFTKKIAFVLIALLSLSLLNCGKKTDENTLCGQVYYEIAPHKKIIGDCSVKLYKAEGININLVTAIPPHVTIPNSSGYYEFKNMPSDNAWWLVASVNYIDTTDLTKEKYTCDEIVGVYDLSKNTKTEVDIYMNIK